MAKSLKLVTTKMLKNLTIGDVMCPICRGIFIKPVLMPCKHALCLQCFERTMEENSLTCPLCRKRIGGWLRTATKDQNLVHDELWTLIKKRFPKQVEAKLNGEDDGVEEHVVGQISTHISSPGEIRKEYEQHIKQLEEEEKQRRESELRASEELIRKIQEEEERQYRAEVQKLLHQAAIDEQLAKELQEQAKQSTSGISSQKGSGMDNKENKSTASKMRGPMDSYVSSQQKKSSGAIGKFLTTSENTFSVKCSTSKHKELEKFRSPSNISASSHDSIQPEMHHFKPIKSVPRTPPKKFTDARVLIPRVVKAMPVNLSPMYESMESSGADPTYISSSFRQQLLKVQQDRYRNLNGVLRTSEVFPPVSAFRGKEIFPKSDHMKIKSSSSQLELSEDSESPRKRARHEEQRSDCSMVGLSSYSNEKVIAIVNNRGDVLVEEEGEIGGHDRRFGGSEKEDLCAFNLSKKERCKKRKDSEESCDLDYEDPDVTRIIGIEAEVNSQPMEEKLKSESTQIQRAGVNTGLQKLCINTADKIPQSYTSARTAVHQFQRKNHNNNNDTRNVHPAGTKVNCISKNSAPEKCLDNLDEILPFDEQAGLLLSEEQVQIERAIRQEQEDYELALRLQREYEIAASVVDRSKGSHRAYELRNANKTQAKTKKGGAKKAEKGRQSTLEESFTAAARSRKR